MKPLKYFKIIAIAILCIQFCGCTTSEKFTVVAPSGSHIYTPNRTTSPIATTRNSGRAEIEIPSDMYCGYLLVRAPGNGKLVPMGLDYKHASHMGSKVALVTGITLSSVGVAGLAASLIGLAVNGSDDVIGYIFAGAGGATLLGTAFGWPAQSRLRQTAYDYNFAYNKVQTFNMPQLSFQLKNPNPTKEQLNDAPIKEPTRKKAISGESTKSNSLTTTGTKAKKLKSNISSDIIGIYKGSGELLFNKNLEESYSDITAIIEQVDKNHVTVRITESGEDFFETTLTFLVKKGSNGSYDLTMEDLPEVMGSVSKAGVFTLSHPKVNIEDSIYTLTIVAKK